jgi:hypothetical protein
MTEQAVTTGRADVLRVMSGLGLSRTRSFVWLLSPSCGCVCGKSSSVSKKLSVRWIKAIDVPVPFILSSTQSTPYVNCPYPASPATQLLRQPPLDLYVPIS